MKIYDFNKSQWSDRIYRGNAGYKQSIIYNNECWMLKFPRRRSPLSEYVGSHVYQLLKIPVQETLLGEYDNKFVVACKDFCHPYEELAEYEGIKNDYVEGLEEEIANLPYGSINGMELEEMKIVMKRNRLFQQMPELIERFWDMFIVDALIGNISRKHTDWGILVNGDAGKTTIAPVYDNGDALNSKMSVSQMQQILVNQNMFIESVYQNHECAFLKEGKKMNPLKYIESQEEWACCEALLRVFPNIDMDKIKDMINEIPEEYNGMKIMNPIQKEYYIKCMQYRYDHVLKPTYEKVLSFSTKYEGF